MLRVVRRSRWKSGSDLQVFEPVYIMAPMGCETNLTPSASYFFPLSYIYVETASYCELIEREGKEVFYVLLLAERHNRPDY